MTHTPIASAAAPTGDPLWPDGHRRAVATLLSATLAINVISLALPVMMLQVYDRVLPSPGTGTLGVLVVGVLVAVLLEAALRLARAYVIGRSGASYEHRIATMAMDRILNADLNRLGGYGIGEFLNRMTSVSKLKDFYSGYALTVLADLAFVSLFILVIALIAGSLALVPVAVLAAFAALSLWTGTRLRRALEARSEADDRRFDFLIEALEGVHTLKAFALERLFERRYEALEAASTARNHVVTERMSALYNIGAAFSAIMIVAVVVVGAMSVLDGALSAGALIAALILSGRTMQPMQRALGLWARYQDYRLARGHLEEIAATPQHALARRPASVPEEGKAPRPEGTVNLEGLTFRRGGTAILDGAALTLRRGEAVLVTGPHGVGRSTLLELIAGIYSADAGRITIDGRPLESYSHAELTCRVGLVRPDALVFRGTVRDNITAFGAIDERQAREVSALLEVDRDVATLPAGFDTMLSGTSADSVPPGLIQRIAITRALAPKPRIILFDNADRTLDRRGYARMYSILARLKGSVSMVLVSEDENIRALADRTLHLEAGTLTELPGASANSNVRPYKELRL